ncbi:MAG: TolC family protein [Candidatus Didemnitutus sp.]|nr:TolC family protein [Candidatus Didemnitutus sp.]
MITSPIRRAQLRAALLVSLGFSSLQLCGSAFAAEDASPVTGGSAETLTAMPLADCIDAAMRQNRKRPASQFAVAIAEAQHRQALSGYWPHVTLKAAYTRMDEAPNFIFPAGYMGVPPQAINVPEGTAIINVPAGVFGPTAMQLPVITPAQTITTSGQLFPIPAQDIKLMDPESLYASVNATWLLFDGGMRKGYREQAAGLVAMMKADARRTDLEITDTVKRYYYGAVLAQRLHEVGNDTLARMEATLSLTESLYKEGSGRVQKIDYLDNKIMVESLRAMVFSLQKNEAMARAALANAIGLPWHASIRPADRELPAAQFVGDISSLVGSAYQFSPDWATVEAGLRSLEGSVTTARSGHAPKLALTGELHRWRNNYESGTATATNKSGYTVALGFEIPIFDGFLTRHKVAEARARVAKLKEEQFLLKDGIGLQIKDVFLGLHAAQQSQQATLAALEASQENRDLTTRAYQNELVETEKMVRAQLVEALMSAQHLKARYDLVVLQSRLALLVGTDLAARLDAR